MQLSAEVVRVQSIQNPVGNFGLMRRKTPHQPKIAEFFSQREGYKNNPSVLPQYCPNA